MVKIKEAVFDAGPFIHLYEINQLPLLALFLKILSTPEVLDECRNFREKLLQYKNIVQKGLTAENKNVAKYILGHYSLDLGEATALALCKQEQISFFFTDDLQAREVAQNLGFKAHGTLGIILRALREKLITTAEAKVVVENLSNSSLFFTKDLQQLVLKEIEAFGKRKV